MLRLRCSTPFPGPEETITSFTHKLVLDLTIDYEQPPPILLIDSAT